MKNFIPALATTIALASFSTIASADETPANTHGFYVGGNYGYLKLDGDDNFDQDSNHDVKQGVIGYRINQYLALEGSYIDFGRYGNDVTSAKTDGYTAAVKGTIPVGNRVELFAKAGQLWYSTDYSVASYNDSSNDTGVFAGAGVGFKVTNNFLVNAQYTWYDMDLDAKSATDSSSTRTNTDFNQASVGAEYRF
ncbi:MULTISPECIES: porin family protein [Marinomonas]|uniref:porin family protein n=1 Tax=Marinomonas TaxID=28253 RepID=UPI001056728C|nr:porin family protein [Marinomonas flavescens]